MRKQFNPAIIALAVTLMLSGCASPPPEKASKPALRRDQMRPIEALPLEVAADTITVGQFRRVCDAMARSLVYQPFIARSSRPPVITIRKLQNKTGLELDEQIFQETIRVKLMENAGGLVLFRDDVSFDDIMEERVRQSGEEITVTLTDSMVSTRTYDRVKEREFQTGSLSGTTGSGEQSANIEKKHEVDMSQTASIKSKIAAADYFLRGIIYQVKERDVNNPDKGMNYFQYQFRLVDARNGLIVWEKMLSSKMEGQYEIPVQPAGQGQAGAGTLPAGWPTGQVPGAVPPGAVPQGTAPGAPMPAGTPQPYGQAAPAAPPNNSIQQMNELQKGVLQTIQQIQQMNQ